MAKRIKDKRRGKRRRPMLEKLKKEQSFMENHGNCSVTDKDKVYADWIHRRTGETNKADSKDTFIFLMSARAVTEMERLYDHIDCGVNKYFPEIDREEFFRSIKIFIGKYIGNIYLYLTDWKTLMFTIAGDILGCQTFPILGYHYQVAVCTKGYFEILTLQGQIIAMIPVLQGVEKTDERIYPQNGEPLENGDLKHTWEHWYELNKLINNEEEWFKMMKYYDEVFNYIVDNDLFNKKKIMPFGVV